MFLDIIMILALLNLTRSYNEIKFSSLDFIDCYISRATSNKFMKELAQSDLLFLSYGYGYITTPKMKKKKLKI